MIINEKEKESENEPVLSACSSFVFQSSATSLASGSSGFGALIKAWIDKRTVRICNAGLHLSIKIEINNKEFRLEIQLEVPKDSYQNILNASSQS